MLLPQAVDIVEVGPRDGLQNEPFFVDTGTKIELLNCLIETGLKRVEATAFVHPRWIPRLRDAAEVLAGVGRPPGVRLSVLVPNFEGYKRARAVGIEEVNVVVSATESHNHKNVNCGIEDSLRHLQLIAEAAVRDGVLVRGSVAVSFGCPYEGRVEPEKVVGIAARLWEMGCHEVVLADTSGVANPVQVYNLFLSVREKVDGIGLAAHFHDARGLGMANVLAALQAGVVVFDCSVGGLGGCPYAPGAPGNIASETLVETLAEMNIKTGVDPEGLRKCAKMILGLKAARLSRKDDFRSGK